LFTVGNQTALYTQAPENLTGTAAGLVRTFGYLGSIGSSALTGMVFGARVDDGGLHTIAIILIAVSILVLFMTVADRKLRSPQPSPVSEDHRRPQ